jgi:hypothetical protein
MAAARRLAREPMLPSAMRWPWVRMAGPAWHRGLHRAFMSGTGRPGCDHGGAAAAWRAAGEPGQCQQARGFDVIGGESIHRVTAAAFAAARPGIWPGGVHRAPTASAGCAATRAP